MIFTITLNTGFDEVFSVQRVQSGIVSEVLSYRSLPSGKGINAGRVIHALGGESRVMGFVGHADRSSFETLLLNEGLSASLVPVPGATRRNLTLIESGANYPASHFRAGGFKLEKREPFEALLKLISSEVQSGDLVSLHGSTPEGLSADSWAQIATLANDCGARILVDIYGRALPVLLETVRVLACKPNQEEILDLTVRSGLSLESGAVDALRVMRNCGVEFPFVSLGAAGIAFWNEEKVWRAFCAAPREVIFVGAGDACMAALACSLSRGTKSIVEITSYMAAVAAAHVAGLENSQLQLGAEQLLGSVQVELYKN